jgi:hypothetical protein
MRLDRVWFAFVAGRCGWGVTVGEAMKSALRGAVN